MTQRGTVRRRTQTAVARSPWIDRDGMDSAAVGVVYALADQIDLATRPKTDDVLFDEQAIRENAGKVAFVAQVFLKNLDALGLTPTARQRFVDDEEPADDLVASLRLLAGGGPQT